MLALPISLLILTELIADLLPAGVLNIVNGYGREAGMPLANSKRIAKIAFTGSTSTGRVIAQAAANNLIPATLELGGKSPNIFFADTAFHDLFHYRAHIVDISGSHRVFIIILSIDGGAAAK